MKKNIILKFIIMVSILVLIITSLSLYTLRDIGIKSAINNAESISEVVKSGLTSHMKNNNMHQIDTYIKSISSLNKVESLWLIRGDLVSKQYSPNEIKNPSRDNIDKEVLSSGIMKYNLSENLTSAKMRITIPYTAIEDKGIDCLSCHDVKPGKVLGAVSLVLDVSYLKEVGLESIYLIIIVSVLSLFLIIFLSRKILEPYIHLFEKLKVNIGQAVQGKFYKIKKPSGLSGDMTLLTNEYNSLIETFGDTSKDIERKLQGFIGHRAIVDSDNPLDESKTIIANLSSLYQFKKEIEYDDNKDEIYKRLAEVFVNKFNLKNFTFIEIDILKHKMKKVLQEGDILSCEDILRESPELCRTARTKNDVMSMDFHTTCPYFKDEKKFYFCTNIVISKNIHLVINFILDSKEELDELKNKITYIKSYINEAAPSLEVKLLMNALQESAFRDGLTGLYNRKFLEEHSKKLIPQALRESFNIGVLMLDMDHFKAVNDEYGHDIGDKVLKELSRILTETVRESDLVIRYGGEEFVVLLVGVKTEEDAIDVANKIGKRVRENEIDVYAGSTLKKTISIGLSMFPSDSSSIDSVFKNADIALYEAKSSGRDKVIRFKEEQVSSVDLF